MSENSIRFSFAASLGAECETNTVGFTHFQEEKKDRCEAAHIWIHSDAAGLGWTSLPLTPTDAIKEAATWLKGYEAIVHVGIGGSSLGNLMLHQTLGAYYHNELPSSCFPKIFIADNPDPAKVSAIWEQVRDKRCALVGFSKSGQTAETMALFLWFRSKMQGIYSQKEIDQHILVVTDPSSGVFRRFVEEQRCRSLEIPESVGGRYSVLSAGALVTAAAMGIDIDAVLKGAATMRQRLFKEKNCLDNPALRLALTHLFHENCGKNMSVMMPYSSYLERFAEWYAQLWAESLGKNGGGSTPIRALGALDQHSQVQLYAEGPNDKFYTFIAVRNHPTENILPKIDEECLNQLKYLEEKALGEMLYYESMSTASSLIKRGRPLFWIEMQDLSPESIGQLIFFYETVTALTGYIRGINPFDQPGVEQGKAYTYGLMGRDSFHEQAKEVHDLFAPIAVSLQ